MKIATILSMALLLAACAHELHPSLESYMATKRLPQPRTEQFPHCQGYGCRAYKNVVLNKADWKKIEKIFGKKAKNVEQEREKIAKTIGQFEKIVGPITGTGNDKRGTFIQTGYGQLDCVDESLNTTIYMMLLKEKGLIVFHEIAQPQVRWPIISGRGWMHQTAVVTEKETGKQYAIDSWFEDNGVDPWVVPIEEWQNGFHPDQVKNKPQTP